MPDADGRPYFAPNVRDTREGVAHRDHTLDRWAAASFRTSSDLLTPLAAGFFAALGALVATGFLAGFEVAGAAGVVGVSADMVRGSLGDGRQDRHERNSGTGRQKGLRHSEADRIVTTIPQAIERGPDFGRDAPGRRAMFTGCPRRHDLL